MTWQRIDVNTYIDDSLVTCAEYQLFIDEMREQGKYYQPGHWASCQFPRGQARKPSLGVRPSHARDFSEWLGKRNAEEWNYRLPTPMEADGFALHKTTPYPAGYWCATNKPSLQFTWVGITRSISNKLNLALSLAQDTGFLQGIVAGQDLVSKNLLTPNSLTDFSPVWDRGHNLAYDLMIDKFNKQNCEIDLGRELILSLVADTHQFPVNDIENARDYLMENSSTRAQLFETVRDLKKMFEPPSEELFSGDISPDFLRPVIQISKMTHCVANDQDLHRNIDCALIRSLALVQLYALDIVEINSSTVFRNSTSFSMLLGSIRHRMTYNRLAAKLILAMAIDLFRDLFILRERIAGRSPAFEGIRLVKERTK